MPPPKRRRKSEEERVHCTFREERKRGNPPFLPRLFWGVVKWRWGVGVLSALNGSTRGGTLCCSMAKRVCWWKGVRACASSFYNLHDKEGAARRAEWRRLWVLTLLPPSRTCGRKRKDPRSSPRRAKKIFFLTPCAEGMKLFLYSWKKMMFRSTFVYFLASVVLSARPQANA